MICVPIMQAEDSYFINSSTNPNYEPLGPTLWYNPTSYDLRTMIVNENASTTFHICNNGNEILYFLIFYKTKNNNIYWLCFLYNRLKCPIY